MLCGGEESQAAQRQRRAASPSLGLYAERPEGAWLCGTHFTCLPRGVHMRAQNTEVQVKCKLSALIGRAGASPPSRTTGTIFLHVCVVAPSVSPDTVSLLNVSTRFYLGVHAVRKIATTVYGLRSLALA